MSPFTAPPGPERGSVRIKRSDGQSRKLHRGTQAVVKLKGRGQQGGGLKWELSAYVSVPAAAAGLGLASGRRARSTGATFCLSALLHNTFGNSQVAISSVCACRLEKK